MTVYVLGGYQTDFAEKADGLYELVEAATLGALDSAGVQPAEVGVAHVGNVAGELFGGQAQLGGFVNTVHPDLAELPTARHEAACASGSIAVLAAMADLELGRYDVALVAGVELMRNVGGKVAAEHLGSAAWVGREAIDAAFPWPHLFSLIADAYAHRWGRRPWCSPRTPTWSGPARAGPPRPHRAGPGLAGDRGRDDRAGRRASGEPEWRADRRRAPGRRHRRPDAA